MLINFFIIASGVPDAGGTPHFRAYLSEVAECLVRLQKSRCRRDYFFSVRQRLFSAFLSAFLSISVKQGISFPESPAPQGNQTQSLL